MTAWFVTLQSDVVQSGFKCSCCESCLADRALCHVDSDSRQWSSNSGYQGSRDWSKGKQQQWSSSSNDWWGSNENHTPTVPAAKPVIPANFKSDDQFFDSTAVGSGNHQFHRVLQSTDWSRKAQIAGRPVDDLRVFELCFRGLSEFSLRMLSEGRFQSIVWTRNSAQSLLVTQLLKRTRG